MVHTLRLLHRGQELTWLPPLRCLLLLLLLMELSCKELLLLQLGRLEVIHELLVSLDHALARSQLLLQPSRTHLLRLTTTHARSAVETLRLSEWLHVDGSGEPAISRGSTLRHSYHPLSGEGRLLSVRYHILLVAERRVGHRLDPRILCNIAWL